MTDLKIIKTSSTLLPFQSDYSSSVIKATRPHAYTHSHIEGKERLPSVYMCFMLSRKLHLLMFWDLFIQDLLESSWFSKQARKDLGCGGTVCVCVCVCVCVGVCEWVGVCPFPAACAMICICLPC